MLSAVRIAPRLSAPRVPSPGMGAGPSEACASLAGISGLARICGRLVNWSYRCTQELFALAGVGHPVCWWLFPTLIAGEVAHSSAAYPRRWVQGGSGLSLCTIRLFKVVTLLRSPWLAVCRWLLAIGCRLTAPGVSERLHVLLSERGMFLSDAAQHKNGFPAVAAGNPVERTDAKNRPRRRRRDWAG